MLDVIPRDNERIRFTADGRSVVSLVAGTDEELAHIVDVASGTRRKSFAVGPLPKPALDAFALLADGKRMLVGGA